MNTTKPSGRTMITLGVSVTPELKARIPRLPNGLLDQEWLRAAIMEKLESVPLTLVYGHWGNVDVSPGEPGIVTFEQT